MRLSAAGALVQDNAYRIAEAQDFPAIRIGQVVRVAEIVFRYAFPTRSRIRQEPPLAARWYPIARPRSSSCQ